MAYHERKLLRDAIKLQLIAGVSSVAGRVDSSRVPPVSTATLPCLSVYTNDEAITEASKQTVPRELKREPIVAIVAWAAVPAGGAVDDALDALALEIETAMDEDQYLDSNAGGSVLLSTELGIFAEGARPMGVIKLEYQVEYRTNQRLTATDDIFDSMGVRINQAGVQHEDDEQSDLVENIHE